MWHSQDRDDIVQWVASLTRNWSVLSSNPIKGSRCFTEQETLNSLRSTGWLQERNRA